MWQTMSHMPCAMELAPAHASPSPRLPLAFPTKTSRGSLHTTRSFQRNLDLLRSVFEQAQRETRPWVEDIVEPARVLGTSTPLPPLPDTQSPTTLGDEDSRFLQVNDLMVHYKEVVLPPKTQQHTSNGVSSPSTSSSMSSTPPALLLLHGFNGSVFNWRCVMHELADAMHTTYGTHTPVRVIAFDRPPFGLTTRPRVTVGGDGDGSVSNGNGGGVYGNAGAAVQSTKSTTSTNSTSNTNNNPSNNSKENTDSNPNPYSPAGAAHLAVSLLQALGVSQAIVVGHSAGAGVAMEVATRYPTITAGLVFICPALPDASGRLFSPTLGTQLRLAALRAVLSRDDTGRQYVRRVIGRRRQEVLEGKVQLYGDGSTPDADAVDGYLRPMRAHDWDIGMLETMRVFSLGGVYEYTTLPHPVLFVQGEQDEPLATQARKVYATLAERTHASTTYVELPGVGHIPMEEASGVTADAVRGWLVKEYGGGVGRDGEE